MLTVEEVVQNLYIPIDHNNQGSWDVTCPVCAREPGKGKRKLNINWELNCFRCNRCGISGNAENLYTLFSGNSDYWQPDLKRDSKVLEEKKPAVKQSPRAPDKEIHNTYTHLLNLLPLSDYHRHKLRLRGLMDDEIGRLCFRSTPMYGHDTLTDKLLDAGCKIEGVPGFYYNEERQRWSMYVPNWVKGILIPIRSMDGLISALQIRLDQPIDKMKYNWLTTSKKYLGVTAGAPVHCIGDIHAKKVFFTEGGLKGSIAHCVSGRTFCCVVGAGQYTRLKDVLLRLKENGVEDLYDAYDMDKLTKESVRKGVENFFRIALECGFQQYQLHQLIWNPELKGVDDWQVSVYRSAVVHAG